MPLIPEPAFLAPSIREASAAWRRPNLFFTAMDSGSGDRAADSEKSVMK